MAEFVKLKDLGAVFIGLTYKPEDVSDVGTIVLRSGNIQEGQFDLRDIVRVSCPIKNNLVVHTDDILMCSRNGSARLVGKCTLIPPLTEPMMFGAFMTIIRTPYNRYLRHFFDSHAFRTQLNGSATTTINQITKRMLDEIVVPFPEFDKQQQIACILDRINDLISKRKQQLEKLDELVKARFVEMFDDPIANTLGWHQAPLRELTSKIGSGATPKGGKESYQAEGITLIRSMNVHDGRFEYKDLAHITDEQAAQLDNVTVEENDVFINITGASVARSCIVPKGVLPARVNQHVAIIRCIRNQLNPVFVNSMFLNDRFKGQLLDIGESGGATRQAITKQQLEALTVIVPPLELQDRFAAFAEQTDKSKAEIQKSLEQLETLKKALMQKYFG